MSWGGWGGALKPRNFATCRTRVKKNAMPPLGVTKTVIELPIWNSFQPHLHVLDQQSRTGYKINRVWRHQLVQKEMAVTCNLRCKELRWNQNASPWGCKPSRKKLSLRFPKGTSPIPLCGIKNDAYQTKWSKTTTISINIKSTALTIRGRSTKFTD